MKVILREGGCLLGKELVLKPTRFAGDPGITVEFAGGGESVAFASMELLMAVRLCHQRAKQMQAKHDRDEAGRDNDR